MNVICYFRTHFDDPSNTGVVEKCRALARALGPQTQSWFFSQNGLCRDHSSTVALPFRARKHSWRHAFLYYYLSDYFLAKTIDFTQFDLFYIRHLPAHPAFLHLLKKAKQQNPALRIVLELPTWPYDKESNRAWSIVRALDKKYRKQLYTQVDVAVHLGAETRIWNIPALTLSNGIDLTSAPLRHAVLDPEGVFRLIAVGSWTYWQGLDRILEGMSHAKAPSVRLTVVGDGPSLNDLKKLTRHLGLDKKVEFTGPLRGKALDTLFDRADMAVGVLGLHRKGLSVASPLKHREYCLRGIPFVMAGKDSDIPPDLPWVCYAEDRDGPVAIADLQAWYQALPPASGLRAFAQETLGWESRVKKILTYVSSLRQTDRLPKDSLG